MTLNICACTGIASIQDVNQQAARSASGYPWHGRT
jgi:hypothetical protein